MKTTSHISPPRRGSRRQPEASRNAILQAALAEFAQEGLAGARVDAIAEAAGVNKALLYYYFRDKETLYGATLENFFAPPGAHQPGPDIGCERRRTLPDLRAGALRFHRRVPSSRAPLSGGADERQPRRQDAPGPHLDAIHAAHFACACWACCKRASTAASSARSIRRSLRPLAAAIVHYFLTAPLRRKLRQDDPYSPASAIADRRAAVLDFIAAALFADREAGIKLAARIAARPCRTSERAAHPASSNLRRPARKGSANETA